MHPSDECLFCKMARGALFVPKIYEDESFFSIQDIHPQAKVHLLVIPKEHISSLADLFLEKAGGKVNVGNRLLEVANEIAREQGLFSGFRCVINTGKDAGQTVFHLHLHVLGGEPLRGNFGSYIG